MKTSHRRDRPDALVKLPLAFRVPPPVEPVAREVVPGVERTRHVVITGATAGTGAAPTRVDVHSPAGGFRQREQRPPPIHVVAQAVTPPPLEHQHLGPRRVYLRVFFERGAEAGFALNAKPLVPPPQPRGRRVRIGRGSLVTVDRRLDRFPVRRRRRGGFRWRRRRRRRRGGRRLCGGLFDRIGLVLASIRHLLLLLLLLLLRLLSPEFDVEDPRWRGRAFPPRALTAGDAPHPPFTSMRHPVADLLQCLHSPHRGRHPRRLHPRSNHLPQPGVPLALGAELPNRREQKEQDDAHRGGVPRSPSLRARRSCGMTRRHHGGVPRDARGSPGPP